MALKTFENSNKNPSICVLKKRTKATNNPLILGELRISLVEGYKASIVVAGLNPPWVYGDQRLLFSVHRFSSSPLSLVQSSIMAPEARLLLLLHRSARQPKTQAHGNCCFNGPFSSAAPKFNLTDLFSALPFLNIDEMGL